MIKTVIFDVDNTLYDFDKAHAVAFDALSAYAAREFGLSKDEFAHLAEQTQSRLKKHIGDKAAIHNRTIRFQNMLENQGFMLHPHVLKMDAIYWDTLIDVSVPSDGVQETVKQLKDQGFRIGIGTDMTARMQFRKLEALGLLPYIDFLVSSEEAGVEKPDFIFFARCVEKAGCEGQECLFIGDSLQKDVLGAMKAGLKALWYCPKGYHNEADVPQMTDMLQLPRLISEL